MRNLKKLFAVIMAVAMLASVMVPALAAEGFKYEAEAKKLYDLGLFKGNSETSYEPDLGTALNRQAGLALAIRLMGKDAEVAAMTQEEIATQLAKIVDANEISDWAKPYAAYAVKNGLTNGIDPNILPNVKFGAQLDLTGKEFINFVLKAMGYQVAWDDVLTKAASIGMLSAGDAVTFGTTAVMTRDLAVGVMASALGGTTASGVTLAQALIDAGAVSAEAMAAAGFFTPTATPEPTPAVLEATASTTNNIQINVVYNEEVDKDSATKLDNYKLSKGDIEKAELQDDGVTVVLTLKYASAKNQEDKVDLTIKNVKSTSGIVIAETTLKDILFLDKDIPTVVDAQVVGKDTVKVIFSEPMKGTAVTNGSETTYFLNKDGFVVNGGKLYVKEAKLQKNYTEALVKLYSNLPEGEVTFQVKSTSEDFAGFGVIGKLFTLNVVKDTEAPVVTGYENAKPTEVTLIWSEDIEFDTKTLKEWYHTNGSNIVKDVTIDGNKTKLTFADDKKLAPGTAYVYVLKEAVKDLWGNKNAQQMIQVEVVLDVTAPEVSEVKQGDNEQTVIVKYNEAMDSDSTKKASNYTILDKDGKEQKDLVKSVTLSSDGKEATLNLSKKIGGEYSLVIKGVKDLAGNEIVEVTVPFKVEDKTTPKTKDFSAKLYNAKAKDQMLKISFGEAMATEGQFAINDLAKYMLGTKNVKDIKNASITVVDNGKAVEIKIPSKADDKDKGYDIDLAVTPKVTVARVADAAGNFAQVQANDNATPVDALWFEINIAPAATVAIDKVEATDRETIKVTFKDEVKFEIADFIVNKTVAGDVYKMSYAEVDTTLNDKGNTVATLKLTEKLPFEWGTETGVADTTVTFVVYGENGTQSKVATENKYGEKVALGETAVADKIAPELYDDGKDTNLFGDSANRGYKDCIELGAKESFTFKVHFSEWMKTALNTGYTGADFVITIGDKTLVNGKDYVVTDITNNVVTFKFTQSYAEVKENNVVTGYKVSGDFTIKLADKTNYLTDIAGNAPKAFDLIKIDDVLFQNATWN
jgi:hypothetical protein